MKYKIMFLFRQRERESESEREAERATEYHIGEQAVTLDETTIKIVFSYCRIRRRWL
jgi:hypothetical protein